MADAPLAAAAEPVAGPTTDETLMAAFSGGDGAAFELLVARHGSGLLAFLFRSVGDRARAEELLQEVFLRIVRTRGQYRVTARFTTWAYTIARNLCVDESRRARFRRHASLETPRTQGDESRSLRETLAADGPGAEDLERAPQLRERLLAAIDTLPEDQREVFVLRQGSGLSFREIAEVVGIPENTVKSRMRYALEKLRVELADFAPSAPEPAHAKEAP